MDDEFDFSGGKRETAATSPGKTRVTVLLDDDVVEAIRARAHKTGTEYHALINAALREAISSSGKKHKPLTVETLRRVLREELKGS
jgi:uncharacterized protein (DUF4415 family)